MYLNVHVAIMVGVLLASTYTYAAQSDDKRKQVSPPWFVTLSIALRKHVNKWEYLVLAYSL